MTDDIETIASELRALRRLRQCIATPKGTPIDWDAVEDALHDSARGARTRRGEKERTMINEDKYRDACNTAENFQDLARGLLAAIEPDVPAPEPWPKEQAVDALERLVAAMEDDKLVNNAIGKSIYTLRCDLASLVYAYRAALFTAMKGK